VDEISNGLFGVRFGSADFCIRRHASYSSSFLSHLKYVFTMKKMLSPPAKARPLLLLLMAAWLFACEKDNPDCPPDLPCATQSGENTFGCYINGKPWVADIAPYILDPTLHKIEAEYDENGNGSAYGNFLFLKGRRTNDTTSGFMYINLRPVLGLGKISHVGAITFDIGAYIVRTDNGQPIGTLSFELDTFFSYNIEITRLDTSKKIVAGRFAFTGTSLTDTVIVTDGRFDVRYDPY